MSKRDCNRRDGLTPLTPIRDNMKMSIHVMQHVTTVILVYVGHNK